jgi:hypothetical protein
MSTGASRKNFDSHLSKSLMCDWVMPQLSLGQALACCCMRFGAGLQISKLCRRIGTGIEGAGKSKAVH